MLSVYMSHKAAVYLESLRTGVENAGLEKTHVYAI
jgi:hypothetical protein